MSVWRKSYGLLLTVEKGDHPELDMSLELNEEGHAIYMSLVRQSQWLISLGQFDIPCAIMMMSHLRAALHEGHMKRMKRIYGYVKQYPKSCIRVRVDLPDYTDLHVDTTTSQVRLDHHLSRYFGRIAERYACATWKTGHHYYV